ncbi:flagellar hook-length control protein FliK [Shewanella sp. 10N.286.48.A6]|uniref:flagellar hook-length control protein FliK n=1 Tax=Shewanella sp. 10N.286.48.A6 TaxID=1880833 RepID=UPI000C84B664|nr:flagellar hook-length control protein FliK [Shewanella sp. 10N.286.48.A6]PMH98570.1 hypothetical protein BCU55_15525 [Shewanella sp. 10N.286.48.A6]
MINNIASFAAGNSSIYHSANNPQQNNADTQGDELGMIGFVMPTVEARPDSANTSAPLNQGAQSYSGTFLASDLPANVLAELKQHPQLKGMLTQDSSGQLQFQLPANADAAAKAVNSDAQALLALIQQFAEKATTQAGDSVNNTNAQIGASISTTAVPIAPLSMQQSTPISTQKSSTPLSSSPMLQQASVPASHSPMLQQAYSPAIEPPISATSFAAIQPVTTEAANSDIDSINQVIQQLTATTQKSQNPVSQWGPVSVTQSAPLLHQANEIMSPLRDQLRFQIDQQIKHAELRLDPPELGKVELNIRLDGDRLHVQMHAANPAVRDALLMGLDRLRMELEMDHGGQVDIDMGQQQSEQHAQQPLPLTNAESAIEHQASEQQQTAHRTQQDQVDLLA